MGGTGGPRDAVTDAAAVAAVADALAPVVPPGAGVVLAVSGGPDSVGMAHLVLAARPDVRATVVHVRHGLRDDAADATVAQQHARFLQLPFEMVRVNVTPDGTGPENAARTARLDALRAAAGDAGARIVLTGHTADDNAETMLLNIARGAGLGGLAGIPPVRRLGADVLLARPVLDLRRTTVRAVATATGLPVAQDPTNDDPLQRRARARSQLLPLLQSLTGGDADAVEALARLARHARSDTAALDTIATQAAQGIVRTWGPVTAVAASALSQLPDAVADRIVRDMITGVSPGPPPSFAAITAARAVAVGRVATLPGGVVASLGGGWLAVGPPGATLPARRLAASAVSLPEVSLELRCERASDASPDRVQDAALPPWAPAAAPASVASRTSDVVVRARVAGDRIRTAAGTKTVADAMIDAGVPRIARDLVPVVEDDDGLLWVPGVAVRAGAAGDLRLRLARPHGK